jgi:hypothetical protein
MYPEISKISTLHSLGVIDDKLFNVLADHTIFDLNQMEKITMRNFRNMKGIGENYFKIVVGLMVERKLEFYIR